MSSQTKVWLSISIGVVLLAILLFFVFFFDARLTIVPQPSTATILLNGQPVAPGKAVKLRPGAYEITAQAPGFIASTQKITLGVSQLVTLPITLIAIPTVQQVTSDAKFAEFDATQKKIFYLGNSGKQFFRIATTGDTPTPEAITADRFANLTDVIWNPTHDLAILKKSDGTNTVFDFKRYDFVSQEEQQLSRDFGSIAWNPSGVDVIGFISNASGERSLTRHTVATGVDTRLIDLRSQALTNPQLRWSPNGKQIAVVENGAFTFDVATKELTKLAGTDGAKAASWSPDSTKLAVELADKLVVITPSDPATPLLSIQKAQVTKSIWLPDSAKVVTATSTDQQKDLLTEIPLAQTETAKQYVYTSPTQVNASNLFFDSTKEVLWFTNTGTLSKLPISRE